MAELGDAQRGPLLPAFNSVNCLLAQQSCRSFAGSSPALLHNNLGNAMILFYKVILINIVVFISTLVIDGEIFDWKFTDYLEDRNDFLSALFLAWLFSSILSIPAAIIVFIVRL